MDTGGNVHLMKREEFERKCLRLRRPSEFRRRGQ